MRTYAHKPRAKARRRYMTEAEYAVYQSRFQQHADANAPKTEDGAVKRGKHRNVKVEHDGIVFDSKKELRVWLSLSALAARGEITELRRQVRFELLPAVKLHGEKRTKPGLDYVADFVFIDAQGRQVVQDAKSKHTRTLAEYRTRKHMMKSLLNLDIEEV
jgi:hypothetical protein